MNCCPALPDTGTRKFCLQCDDGTKLKLQTKSVIVAVRGESCVVPKVTGGHCPVCGEIEYTDNDSSDRVWNAIEAMGEKAKTRVPHCWRMPENV